MLPLFIGIGVAGAAYGAKFAAEALRPTLTRMSTAGVAGVAGSGGKSFYKGGFEAKMSRREAHLILGIKEGAPDKDVKKAWKTLMMVNHPDYGGSPYVASKVNEAAEMLKKRS